jgi:hypothetical protein
MGGWFWFAFLVTCVLLERLITQLFGGDFDDGYHSNVHFQIHGAAKLVEGY